MSSSGHRLPTPRTEIDSREIAVSRPPGLVPREALGAELANESAASGERSRNLRLLRAGTWLTLGGVVAGNVAPVLVVLLARTFPPEAFGLYVSLQLMVLTVSKFATLGLDRGLAWYIARQPLRSEQSARALASATALALLLSVAVVAGVALAGWSGVRSGFFGGGEGDGAMVTLCFLALPPWCVLHLHAGALEGLRHPGYRIFLNQGLVTALAPASALALHALGFGRWALPLGLVLANGVGAVWIVCAARRRLPRLRRPLELRLDRSLLAYSWPVGISDVVAGVRARADLWLVLALAGPRTAGIYAVMNTLPSGVRVIRQTYDPVVIAVVSSMGATSRKHLSSVFSYAVHMVSSLQLLIALFVLLFPRELLSLAGRDYVFEPSALWLLSIAHVLQGSLGMPGAVLLGLGQSRTLLVCSVGGLILGVLTNLWWIPQYGVFGAAISSAVTALVTSLILLGLQLRLTKSWLYARHLWSNAALIVALVTAAVSLRDQILDSSLVTRCALAAVGVAFVSANALWKRGRLDAPRAARAPRPARVGTLHTASSARLDR
jgi:O-antigen/teichoic acid export membrane protein